MAISEEHRAAARAALEVMDARDVQAAAAAAPPDMASIQQNPIEPPRLASGIDYDAGLAAAPPQSGIGPTDPAAAPQPQPPAAQQPVGAYDPMAMQAQQMADHEAAAQQLGAHLDADRKTTEDVDVMNLKNTEQNIDHHRAAVANEIGARQDVLALTAQQDAAKAAFTPQQIEIQKHQIEALQKLDDWHAVQEQQTLDRQNQFRDQMITMSNEHPEDVWGNASIAGKISGIIGIIGAGFAGQDAAQRVQQTVQSAVAAHMRKAEFLSQANNQQQNIAATAEKMFGSKQAAINAMTANQYKLVSMQMEQAAAKFANPIAQATLRAASAQAMQASADWDNKTTQATMTNAYKGLDVRVKLDGEEAKMATARAANMTANKMFAIPGRVGGVNQQAQQKLAPIIAGAHTLLEGTDKLDVMLGKLRADRMHPVDLEKAQKVYDQERTMLLTAYKQWALTGQRLEPGEIANFEKMLPTSVRAFSPESLGSARTLLHKARDYLVTSVRHTGEAYGATSSAFDRKFPLYAPSMGRIDSDEAEVDSMHQGQAATGEADKKDAEARAKAGK